MARRPSKKAQSTAAAKLAEALNFIAPAYKDGGQPYQAHARLAGKMLTATDGTFSAGHSVEEELALCPHIGRFIDALNRAGSSLAMTENENGTLLIKGDKIRATVPCIPGDELPQVMPDPKIAAIDDRLKEGFAKLLPLTKAEAERVVEVSILLQANSMYSTNGFALFEYWHGIDLPPALVIPKTFAAAVAACPKKLAGFGFSNKSVTFYYEDDSWYKSQMYSEQWPDVAKLFDFPCFPAPVPEGLFEAVRAIDSFSKDGGVHFHEDKLKTTYDKYQDHGGPLYGATYDVPGLQAGHSFTAKLLRLIEPVCKSLDYTSNPDRAFFFDDANVRGSIMKRALQAAEPAASWTLPADSTGGAVAEAFAAVQGGAWGTAEGSTPETPQEPAPAAPGGGWGTPPAHDDDTTWTAPPADPWAAIGVGTGNAWGQSFPPLDIDEDDIPF